MRTEDRESKAGRGSHVMLPVRVNFSSTWKDGSTERKGVIFSPKRRRVHILELL
jgi:hypothetical protein